MTAPTAAKVRNTLRAAGAKQSTEGTNRNGIARSSGGFTVTANGETKYFKSGKSWRQRTVKDGTFTVIYETRTMGRPNYEHDDAQRLMIDEALRASGWSVTRVHADRWCVAEVQA